MLEPDPRDINSKGKDAQNAFDQTSRLVIDISEAILRYDVSQLAVIFGASLSGIIGIILGPGDPSNYQGLFIGLMIISGGSGTRLTVLTAQVFVDMTFSKGKVTPRKEPATTDLKTGNDPKLLDSQNLSEDQVETPVDLRETDTTETRSESGSGEIPNDSNS